MTLAFVFPGQGAQSVGMLDGYAGHPAVKELLDTAGAALGEDLAGLIASGPAETLALTVNTQPAMLVAGLASFLAWRAAGGAGPVAVAGHSLGEYTALAAAGSLDTGSAVKLVRLRAQAMQEAVPEGSGGMAAILGLDDEQVRLACRQAAAEVPGEVVEPANFNAPAQVVIAGHRQVVEIACAKAKALGAKRALPLAVSAPFHSSLLKPAGERLAAALGGVDLRPPTYTLVNNIDAATESDPARIRDALIRQSYGPVRWVEVVQKLKALGVDHVIEFGPGKVLTGLVPRIDKSLRASAVYDPATLKAVLDGLSGSAA
ncbi:MAG TPA: ACP S-malonyltransferase [Burkholderiaceae bacterium]|nr:ACP S-malonyltransferase [Burkholderiaceae bacterium]